MFFPQLSVGRCNYLFSLGLYQLQLASICSERCDKEFNQDRVLIPKITQKIALNNKSQKIRNSLKLNFLYIRRVLGCNLIIPKALKKKKRLSAYRPNQVFWDKHNRLDHLNLFFFKLYLIPHILKVIFLFNLWPNTLYFLTEIKYFHYTFQAGKKEY